MGAIPTPGNVEVRKYDPKAKMVKKTGDVTSEQYLVSPITGEKVPASKVQEHMRIGLLDPRWVEERDKQITARATEEQVFAPGQSIENSLKHLAERRTDIFGVGEDAAQEAGIGKKMGEEDRRQTEEKITWDGHSSSAEAAARAARANISLNDQIEQIHRSKGLIQDVKGSIRPHSTSSVAMTAPAPVNVVSVPPQPMEEPPSKRARGEDNLMPEADFLARNVSPVTFRILVPSASDKPEWKLNGQMLAVTLPLSDPISAMKAKIHEETGMPPGKQKLQMENIFFKDSNTLAFYNIYPNTVVHLQIKERGGRKK